MQLTVSKKRFYDNIRFTRDEAAWHPVALIIGKSCKSNSCPASDSRFLGGHPRKPPRNWLGSRTSLTYSVTSVVFSPLSDPSECQARPVSPLTGTNGKVSSDRAWIDARWRLGNLPETGNPTLSCYSATVSLVIVASSLRRTPSHSRTGLSTAPLDKGHGATSSASRSPAALPISIS